MGELYSFVSYIFYILASIMMLAFSLLQLTRQELRGPHHRVLVTDSEIKDSGDLQSRAPPRVHGKVVFKNVSFQIPPRRARATSPVGHQLHRRAGQFTAVIAARRRESSLVNLNPLLRRTRRGVIVAPWTCATTRSRALRSRVGMVPKTTCCSPGRYGKTCLGYPEATEEEWSLAGKTPRPMISSCVPDGFDTFSTGRVNVSAGKQRLCIAGAMLEKNPPYSYTTIRPARSTQPRGPYPRFLMENLQARRSS